MCARDTVGELLLIMGRIISAKTGEKPTPSELAKLSHDILHDLQLFFEKSQTTDYRRIWGIDYNTHAEIRMVAKKSWDSGEWPEVVAELNSLISGTDVA